MSIELTAQNRSDMGKGASRRLRRDGQVPAIVYGGSEPVSVSLNHNELLKAQEAADFFSSVLSLSIDGKAQPVVVKDFQRHPAKPLIQHVDFQRADADVELNVRVPLKYINGGISRAVKLQGATIQTVAKTVRVRCKAANLPKIIEVDMKDVQAGQILHISDIQLPEGVIAADLLAGEDHNQPIALVISGRKK